MGKILTINGGDEPPINRDQFMAYLIMQERADNTVRNYSALFLRWIDWATGEGVDPYRPTPIAVRSWARTINGSRSTLAQAKSMIGHLCRALDVDDVSPAVPLPRHSKRQHRGLEHDQAVALAETAKVSGIPGLAVLVGLFTAGRASEIASLSWRRIDFDARRVTLERAKLRDFHTIPLHPHLHALLEPRRIPGEVWVFEGRYGGHVAPKTVLGWVKEVATAAGIGNVTTHQLRHTSLTEAYDSTGDLRAVQDFAGHTKVETTVLYTRVNQRRMDAAIESLNYDVSDEVGEG